MAVSLVCWVVAPLVCVGGSGCGRGWGGWGGAAVTNWAAQSWRVLSQLELTVVDYVARVRYRPVVSVGDDDDDDQVGANVYHHHHHTDDDDYSRRISTTANNTATATTANNAATTSWTTVRRDRRSTWMMPWLYFPLVKLPVSVVALVVLGVWWALAMVLLLNFTVILGCGDRCYTWFQDGRYLGDLTWILTGAVGSMITIPIGVVLLSTFFMVLDVCVVGVFQALAHRFLAIPPNGHSFHDEAGQGMDDDDVPHNVGSQEKV